MPKTPPKMPMKNRSSYGASRGHTVASVKNQPQSSSKPSPVKNKPSSRAAAKPVSPNRQRGFSGGKRPYDYAFYERAEATPAYLARLFAEHHFAVGSREISAYWRYYCLLREHNAALDLTRIMGIEATVLKHFIDCAVVADMLPLGKTVVDIGSGAGFPGVPLALRSPTTRVILAESRGKRVQFLEMVKRDLQLTNVEIFPRSVTTETPLVADDFITRAVEVIPATLARLSPFMAPNGRAIFMKGPNCGPEITAAQQQFKGVFKMTADEKYAIGGREQRRLVVFSKRGE